MDQEVCQQPRATGSCVDSVRTDNSSPNAGLCVRRPEPNDDPPARQICINPLNHGFHVIVGCQAFAVESVEALLNRLSTYLKSPKETERKWLSGELKF